MNIRLFEKTDAIAGLTEERNDQTLRRQHKNIFKM